MGFPELTSEEVLRYMIELLEYYLHDLSAGIKESNALFVKGLRTAYVECLEVITMWKDAERFGLDRDVEARFPI